jgi:hypothetical protein
VVGETFYRRMLILHDTIDKAPAAPSVSNEGVEFRPLEDHEMDGYLRLRPDQTEAEIRSRLEEGQVCFAAVEDGRVVQASWLALAGAAWNEYLDSQVPLGRDEAYTYDWYAAPTDRGRMLFKDQINAIYSYFTDPEERRRWFPQFSPDGRYGFVAAFHIENGAWATLVRMGWPPREIIGYVGFGRLKWRFRRRVKDIGRLEQIAEKHAARRRSRS